MYSGRFMAGAKVEGPPAPPDPDDRHGKKTFRDDAWSTRPAPVATLPAAEEGEQVDAPMRGRGIILDLGYRWGHHGTGRTAASRRPYVCRDGQSQEQVQQRAQTASAAAHGDTNAGYWGDYAPAPEQFAGSSYDVDWAEGRPGTVQPGRRIVHDSPGGQHTDVIGGGAGGGGEFAPTGYRLGNSRRWVEAKYSTPALQAMHSNSPARGVLPQVHTVPVDQPPLPGPIGTSGLSSQQRFSPNPMAIIPRLFRRPTSASDQMIAAQDDGPEYGPAI